ncbi:pimeloyl-ACP methyl ester carboxylesterase [Kibdelosporangium banguiense]|uniref:Pimeloyl-ACP methyl ester carboxylesterase n=1 Tax=Kibdelosporangium banguiense TaxID=1365924 RepID=A0ABS4U241_9PSEU|nr:alpha/beta hydrolase [Kibdelosporangium banguiense]MBP2330712.1 pimeloyl-ACP methyl ester carboxylesterase [Kibdelosporangium banguiense]
MRSRRFLAALTSALAVAAIGFPVAPAQAAVACQDLTLPVTLAGQAEQIYGRLCRPANAKAVQVLVPGASYNSAYWDFPYTPETRSFRLAMNKAGYATLTLDRLGTGRSSRPASLALTSFTQAGVVHQVIQALRAGDGAPKFDKIILGGHSVGSAIAIIEAGTYQDVDAVLITGLTHGINALGAVPILASLIPASLDPKFLTKGYDIGYLTTIAGTRFADFHSPGIRIPGVGETDEQTKDVFATGEVVDTVLLGAILPYSRKIKAPVLLVMGKDPAFCGLTAPDCSTAESLLRAETPYYSPEAALQTFVLPSYGHSLNFAPDAPTYHTAVVNWADSVIR